MEILDWLSRDTLANLLPVPVWVGDAEGRCIFLNAKWTEFTGQQVQDGLDWGFMEAIHPGDRPIVEDAWRSARATSAAYQAEYRLRSKEGTFHWVIDSAAPRFAADGELLCFVGAVTDIAERKIAEQGKAHSDLRLHIALRAAGLGIWEWDLSSNEFYFSNAARQIFGLNSGDRYTFEAIADLIHPDDVESVRTQSAAALDPSLRSNRPYKYRIVRPDGEVRWINAHGEATFADINGRQQATSYIGTFQDVTDGVRVQMEVAASEERMRLAVEAGRLAVWELNLATNQVTHSPELNRFYGFPDEATPSVQDFQSRYAVGEKERLERLGAEAGARGDNEMSTEMQLVLPDGGVRWLYMRARMGSPTPSSEPRVIGVVMDVTERRAGEERLKLVAGELQHRVKNSVAVIQSLAEQTFRDGRAEAAALDAFLKRLRALAAATDLLTRQDWEAAQIGLLIDSVLAPYRGVGEHRLLLNGEPGTELPPKAATGLAMALHELATNAVKYGAWSNSHGTVSLAWSLEGSRLLLVWGETGGPPVPTLRGVGFGTRLLERGVFAGREGKIALNFEPDGLVVEIVVELET